MKPLLTWAELSPKQKEAATAHEYNVLMGWLCEGQEFGDPTVMAGVKTAVADCERMRTPWFLGAAIHELVGDLLMQHVSQVVTLLLYTNPDFPRTVSSVALPSSKE